MMLQQQLLEHFLAISLICALTSGSLSTVLTLSAVLFETFASNAAIFGSVPIRDAPAVVLSMVA